MDEGTTTTPGGAGPHGGGVGDARGATGRLRAIARARTHLAAALARPWPGPGSRWRTQREFADWRADVVRRIADLDAERAELRAGLAEERLRLHAAAAGVDRPDDWRCWMLATERLLRIFAKRCGGTLRPEEQALKDGVHAFVATRVRGEEP